MKVYAVHTLSWLLDECETTLYANHDDALQAFQEQRAAWWDVVREIYSQSPSHLYFEGRYDEQMKISIEEIEVK
tara:strand:+ start:297 stop:518 length:222 start_codon:yes stop_codon:yes gene_type:complete